MDLRSGHAYWLLKNGILASYPALQRDEKCDVAVIGGGITGALLAYHLTRAGFETVLIDKRDIGTGSTAASTSLLQHALDKELTDLIAMVGEEHAVRSYRLNLEAVEKIRTLVRELGDDCGFEPRKTLYLASRRSHVKKLRQEFELRKRFGFSVEYLDERDLQSRFPFAAPGAILSEGDGQIDAYRLTHCLIAKAAAAGLRVYDRTAVSAVETDKEHVNLRTERFYTVSARRVVFATGYESQQFLSARAGNLDSTFALVTEPVAPFPAWPDRCLIWETARPYRYLRTTCDDRIIIGGEDAPFATDHKRDRLLKRKTFKLEADLQSFFPDTDFETAFAWAGTFGSTKDGLAYIGTLPEWPNAYFAVGYGGNGITMGVIAAEIICDTLSGRDNPDAAIFRFDR